MTPPPLFQFVGLLDRLSNDRSAAYGCQTIDCGGRPHRLFASIAKRSAAFAAKRVVGKKEVVG